MARQVSLRTRFASGAPLPCTTATASHTADSAVAPAPPLHALRRTRSMLSTDREESQCHSFLSNTADVADRAAHHFHHGNQNRLRGATPTQSVLVRKVLRATLKCTGRSRG